MLFSSIVWTVSLTVTDINSEFAPKEIALIFVLVSSLNKHSSSPFRTRLVKHLTSERVIWRLWMEVFSQLASMMTKSFPNLKKMNVCLTKLCDCPSSIQHRTDWVTQSKVTKEANQQNTLSLFKRRTLTNAEWCDYILKRWDAETAQHCGHQINYMKQQMSICGSGAKICSMKTINWNDEDRFFLKESKVCLAGCMCHNQWG